MKNIWKYFCTFYLTIEAVSMTSEYPQDGRSVYCYYDYRDDARLQNWVVLYFLRVIGCVMSDACHSELTCPQDGGSGKSLTASIIGFESCRL